jgi:hypothetical protein
MQDVNVEIPTFFPGADRIIAIGDVHGDVKALAGCLKVSASFSLSLSRALCAFPCAPCRLVPTWRSDVLSETMQRSMLFLCLCVCVSNVSVCIHARQEQDKSPLPHVHTCLEECARGSSADSLAASVSVCGQECAKVGSEMCRVDSAVHL